MRSVFIAPHNDDEALFGCYTLLRHKPDVIVVLRSLKQEIDYGITSTTREAESAKALRILGCPHEQWAFTDVAPDWRAIRDRIQTLANVYDHCYAPACEQGGQRDHTFVGAFALAAFGPDRTTQYLTYTTAGKSMNGTPVPAEDGWPEIKRTVLDCYRSQIELPGTAPHFTRPLDEFYA
jgi:LmbE family N-acetylglucosaminyl deacetylase